VIFVTVCSLWLQMRSFSTFCVCSTLTLMVSKRLCLPLPLSKVLEGDWPTLSARKLMLTWTRGIDFNQMSTFATLELKLAVSVYVYVFW